MMRYRFWMRKSSSFTVLALLLINFPLHAQESQRAEAQGKVRIVETKGPEGVVEQVNIIDEMIGRIDWEKKAVYAVGDGVIPPDAVSPAQARVRAKRAAIDTAYARLLEIVSEVRVDAESTTRNYVNENNIVRVKVQGLVKNAEIVTLKHFEDGSYQIMMRMPLTGAQGVSAAIFPIQIERVRKVKVGYEITREPDKESTRPVVIIEKAPVSQMQKEKDPVRGTESQGAALTGLIVDARGLGVKPSLYPKIVSEDGKSVYDLDSANPNVTVEQGLVDYRHTLGDAETVSRAGRNPLVIKGTAVKGKHKTDIVISKADADKIVSTGNASILDEGRVVLVID